MRENPLRIAITPERPVDHESRKISALLSAGWDRVHLRHPAASRREMSEIIGRIDPRLHSRIVLHGHFGLTEEFNLGGLHLNSRCNSVPASYHGPLSRSCHSIDEVLASDRAMSYVTLSPVFDSISKSGYKASFTYADLMRLADSPVRVIALGGVSPETLPELDSLPFAGYAVLGALPWEENETQFITKAKDFLG